ncbi:MAG: hypothetical protein NTX65_08065 [Ignavibacteriales bacterium]|nr:hypothetical protein [Ignavibacteriales bacterium]
MLNRTFTIVVLLLSISSFCFGEYRTDSTHEKKPRYIKGVYRVPLVERDGKKIWIVDGLIIRREIYPEFLYGGNEERYPFIPKNEIWIDHAISVEEFEYTLAHELNERNLMARYGMSYEEAHDSSLVLEHRIRHRDQLKADEHEKKIGRVSPTDCDGLKQLSDLPDSISLIKVYRKYIRTEDGINIWIVDGSNVRRDVFPDFGLSGNDLAYNFIPKNEIWIDGDISCEETEFSITSELVERKFMAQKENYDYAYLKALKSVSAEREKAEKLASRHKSIVIPSILERDTGTGKEKKDH